MRHEVSNDSHPERVFFARVSTGDSQTPVISLRRATKTFGFDDSATDAIVSINLEIQRGEFVAIMGPSGCGKTTLLNILGLLDQPTIGRYLFNGRDVGKFSSSRKARIRNREIGFIFQNFNLVTNMTVLDNVVLPLTYRHGWNYKNLEKASQLLDAIGLKNREYFKPNQLSGGQMQRVAIARALISRPSIILADEPTGNLDTATSRVVEDMLFRLNQERGITLVIVTHDPDLAQRCGRQVRIADGQVVGDQKERK